MIPFVNGLDVVRSNINVTVNDTHFTIFTEENYNITIGLNETNSTHSLDFLMYRDFNMSNCSEGFYKVYDFLEDDLDDRLRDIEKYQENQTKSYKDLYEICEKGENNGTNYFELYTEKYFECAGIQTNLDSCTINKDDYKGKMDTCEVDKNTYADDYDTCEEELTDITEEKERLDKFEYAWIWALAGGFILCWLGKDKILESTGRKKERTKPQHVAGPSEDIAEANQF